MELNAFAQSVATPDYIAMKVADCQNAVNQSQTVFYIALAVLAVAIICAVIFEIVHTKSKRLDEWDIAADISFVVAVVFALVLICAAAVWGIYAGRLIGWQNDPLTMVMQHVAKAL
jgi:uncharacterized membrane protein